MGCFVGRMLVLLGLLQAAGGPVQFRAGVSLVHVPVTVFDEDGRPIRDLGPADFTVLEDGREVTIDFLRPVEAEPGSPFVREQKPPSISAVQFANDQGRGTRAIAIVIDANQIGFRPRLAHKTREFARSLVDGLAPNDWAAVVTLGGRQEQQSDFTQSKAQLKAAIDRFRPMPPLGGAGMADQFERSVNAQNAARAVRGLVQSLGRLEDRGKAIIFISEGGEFNLVEPGTGRPHPYGDQIRSTYLEMIRDAVHDGVPVHTFDPGEMRAPLSSGQRSLQWVSRETNGLAAVNTNAVRPAVESLLDATATHYVLGYYSSVVPDGRYHTIDVKVRRPAARVQARRGFVARPSPYVTDLATAVRWPLPLTDVPVRVAAVPVPASEDVAVLVGIELGEQPGGLPSPHDVLVVAIDMRGAVAAERSLRIPSDRADDIQTGSGTRGATRLVLKPGRYVLRVAARRTRDDAVGTAFAQLDVPEFPGAFSVSPLAVTTDPAVRHVPLAPSDDLIGGVPLATDGLANTAGLQAVVRVRYLPKDEGFVTFVTTIGTGGTGREIDRASVPVKAFRSETGGGIYQVRLPALPQGQYLVSVTATSPTGRKELRTVQLVVRN